MLLNCLMFLLLHPHFRAYVRVWRLILEKSSHVHNPDVNFVSKATPFFLPCKSYVSPIFRPFWGTDLKRI